MHPGLKEIFETGVFFEFFLVFSYYFFIGFNSCCEFKLKFNFNFDFNSDFIIVIFIFDFLIFFFCFCLNRVFNIL